MDLLLKLEGKALEWVDWAVVWIGFSTIVGLVAGLIMLRGRRIPTLLTIALGYVGTIVSWSLAGTYLKFEKGLEAEWKMQLLSPATFVVAVVGTSALLLGYRMMAKEIGTGSSGK